MRSEHDDWNPVTKSYDRSPYPISAVEEYIFNNHEYVAERMNQMIEAINKLNDRVRELEKNSNG